MTNDWQPTPRPIPAELALDFEHTTYMPTETITNQMAGSSIMDRLDHTIRNDIRKLYGLH